jgi:hypothetical protein
MLKFECSIQRMDLIDLIDAPEASVAPYPRATEYSRRAQYCGRKVARASPRLETFIAGMFGPRTEYVESCREHKSSSSLIPTFDLATLDEMIALLPIADGPRFLNTNSKEEPYASRCIRKTGNG